MARTRARGMSLIEIIIGTALMLVVFVSLMGVLRASAGANAIAGTQMEYLRGLSYDALGTVGGIPAGGVSPATTTLANGIIYTINIFVSYVDDAADGSDTSDGNGITTDYKRARVSVGYATSGQNRSVTLVSNFAPPGLESSTGGGTLVIHVVSASGAPVAAATVHISNDAIVPTVDLATHTNGAGQVVLPGAATSSSYQITVTKTGYSTAQTYARDAVNQNPNPGYLTVAKDQTTTSTFAIDHLVSLDLATFSPIETSTFVDHFADASKLAAMSSTTAGGGVLTLAAGETQGSARSVATTSAYLVTWDTLAATTSVPISASVLLHVYDDTGTLIPDSSLPGNAAGFSMFPLSLAGIATSTYPALAVGGELVAGAGGAPLITDWSLSYEAGPIPLPNVSFTLTSTKTQGSTGGGTPIPKTIVSTATGADGTTNVSLEWDSYPLTTPDRDIVDACPSPPYAFAPGDTPAALLVFAPATTNSLRVFVADNAGAAVSGATVVISRSGYTKTLTSSLCGSVYAGSIATANDYSVSIGKPGFASTTFSGVSVSGQTAYGASFP